MVRNLFTGNVSALTDAKLAKRKRKLYEDSSLASPESFVQLFHVAVLRKMLSTTHIHESDANMPAGK